ncbi:unnamed protein product [Effrenium voratum]|nr:unnamed protein product [Effrenium voratum]
MLRAVACCHFRPRRWSLFNARASCLPCCHLQVRSGHGEWQHPKRGSYLGQWKNNQMHGEGLLKANGVKYQGTFSEGRFHEEGELCLADGTVFAGRWRKGLEHGLGRLRLPDGKCYEGQWVKGEVEGQGTLTYGDGRKRYVGQFRAAKPHGHGCMAYADGNAYEGQWQYGVPAGKGRWTVGDVQAAFTPVSSVRPSPRQRAAAPGAGFTESSSELGSVDTQEINFEELQGEDADESTSVVPPVSIGQPRDAKEKHVLRTKNTASGHWM